MNESSAQAESGVEEIAHSSDARSESLATSASHKCFTLIGFSFFAFEILFLELYTDNFWFNFDIAWLGVPAILGAALFAHLFLLLLESPWCCRRLSFLFKGKPAVFYSHWITLGLDGFSVGERHVKYSAVDELELTWLGNLIVRSRAVCGKESAEADPIIKFPLGAGTSDAQRTFINRVREARPDVICNKRLLKRLEAPLVPGQSAIQTVSAAIMALVLLDLGFSSFYYLEMLKNYHLAHSEAKVGNADAAQGLLKRADELREHRVPFSYVTSRFLSIGDAAAGVWESRSHTQWLMGDKDGAIESARKAIELKPDAFRRHLLLARFLDAAGKETEARKEITEAIDIKGDALLPRLYMLAVLDRKDPERARAFYSMYMSEFNDSLFEEEPRWPPGGNQFFHDILYSDDVTFVFNDKWGPRTRNEASGVGNNRHPRR